MTTTELLMRNKGAVGGRGTIHQLIASTTRRKGRAETGQTGGNGEKDKKGILRSRRRGMRRRRRGRARAEGVEAEVRNDSDSYFLIFRLVVGSCLYIATL